MAESFFEQETVVETQGREQPQAAPAEPAALAVSVDEFAALEDRIRRAVELVKHERQARAAAEGRAASAEEQLHAQSPMVEQLKSEASALRAEREHVRQRIERLLAQLDELEL